MRDWVCINYLDCAFTNTTFPYISNNSQTTINRKRHRHRTSVWLLISGQDFLMLCLWMRVGWFSDSALVGNNWCTGWRVLHCPARRFVASRCFYLLWWKCFVTKGQQWLVLLLKIVILTIVTKFISVNWPSVTV